MTARAEAAPGPDFLIIGAPRCGTTSLHDMLGQHPDIFMSASKEPHFFSSFDFPFPENEIHKVTKDEATYRALFAVATGKLCGESSSYYLSDPQAPQAIRAFNPDMKLIAILREPIARAFSHYSLYERRGKQPLSFYDTVKKLVEGQVESPVYDIVGLGKYGEQLTNYYRYFPEGQVHVVMFNDLTKRPKETLESILAFLGVSTAPAAVMSERKPQNQYQVPRSQALARIAYNPAFMKAGLKVLPRPLIQAVRNKVLLKGSAQKQPMDERAVKLLKKVYDADAPVLAKLLHKSPADLWN